MSARSITVSTVGIVPGIRRLAEEPWPVSLAVSLHAADDELRSTLVPINRRYPLAELEEAAAGYFEKKRRRLSIEWTMMDGVNDTTDQAVKLAAIARRLHAHVNLIALNPTPLTKEKASSGTAIDAFARELGRRGVNVTVRDTRGRNIDAACGQLRLLAGKPGLKPLPEAQKGFSWQFRDLRLGWTRGRKQGPEGVGPSCQSIDAPAPSLLARFSP